MGPNRDWKDLHGMMLAFASVAPDRLGEEKRPQDSSEMEHLNMRIEIIGGTTSENVRI
jgi:hypothetical protein